MVVHTVTRAGVIPYTIRYGKVYFLLGVDAQTGEYTDFGGGVKINESVIAGAYREFCEETCEIFRNDVNEMSLIRTPKVTTVFSTCVIFFVYINNKWLKETKEKFYENKEKLKGIKKYSEIKDVEWIEEKFFRKMVYNQSCKLMWKRIKCIINQNITWSTLRSLLMYNYKKVNIC